MLADWIFEENLKAFLKILAWTCDTDFDADDWLAISHGITQTDSDREKWFDYEFSRDSVKVNFALARDVGTQVISVRVQDPRNIDKVCVAFMVSQDFTLLDHSHRK